MQPAVRARSSEPGRGSVNKDMDAQGYNLSGGQAVKLMVKGAVFLNSLPESAVEVCRGMTVLSCEGFEVGWVVAVAMQERWHRAAYLILGHLPQDGSHQAVPTYWIERVQAGEVHLNVGKRAVESLPDWRSG